jgi:hypothetical protein
MKKIVDPEAVECRSCKIIFERERTEQFKEICYGCWLDFNAASGKLKGKELKARKWWWENVLKKEMIEKYQQSDGISEPELTTEQRRHLHEVLTESKS